MFLCCVLAVWKFLTVRGFLILVVHEDIWFDSLVVMPCISIFSCQCCASQNNSAAADTIPSSVPGLFMLLAVHTLTDPLKICFNNNFYAVIIVCVYSNLSYSAYLLPHILKNRLHVTTPSWAVPSFFLFELRPNNGFCDQSSLSLWIWLIKLTLSLVFLGH